MLGLWIMVKDSEVGKLGEGVSDLFVVDLQYLW
jgi:hypothetical protein